MANKHERDRQRIAAFQARFASIPTERLVARYQNGVNKDAQVAIRHILEERQQAHLIRATPPADDVE